MTVDTVPSPVRLKAVAGPGQPEPSPALEQLYRGFESELLVPLWTEIGDLMPRPTGTMRPASLASSTRRSQRQRWGTALLRGCRGIRSPISVHSGTSSPLSKPR